MSEYDLDPGYPVIYCEHCDMTFTVHSPRPNAWQTETTLCTHRRDGKPCRRPFWHNYTLKLGGRCAQVGISPERWAEWQT